MNHGRDNFVPNLLFNIGIIGTIIFWVVMTRHGMVDINWAVMIIIYVVIWLLNSLSPLSFLEVVLFIVLKLLGKITMGWAWIILIIVMAGCMFPVFQSIRDSYK